MKKVLVTGHKGYIGTVLVALLRDSGFEVVGLDTNFFGRECEFSRPFDGIEESRKDLRQVEAEDLEGLYAVCHLAALSNDPLGELKPELTYAVNHDSSLRLAEQAREAGVERFVYSSSCSSYGVAEAERLSESAPLNPVTAYAKSKVLSETSLIALAGADFHVTILRNATAYGISPKLRTDVVVNNLVGWAHTSGEINILSDGTPWRPLVHVEDIARAFVAVLEAPEEKIHSETFNVGRNGENYQIKEVAQLIREEFPGCALRISGGPGSDSRTYNVDFSRIERGLPNFQPRWDLRKGIAQLKEAYQRSRMSHETFMGRRFVRIAQLRHLLEKGRIDDELFWVDRGRRPKGWRSGSTASRACMRSS